MSSIFFPDGGWHLPPAVYSRHGGIRLCRDADLRVEQLRVFASLDPELMAGKPPA
jgi:hypothetical protein